MGRHIIDGRGGKIENRGGYRDGRFGVFTTLFVDNLPSDIRKIWIYNLFQRFGKVCDCFIPNKRSRISGQRFGFVRFNLRDDAITAIAKTNGFWFWNHKLVVKIARFHSEKIYSNGPSDKEHSMQAFRGKILPSGNDLNPHQPFGKSDAVVWKQKEKERDNLRRNTQKSQIQHGIGTSYFGDNKGLYKTNSKISIKLKQVGNEWLHRSVIARLLPTRSMVYVQDQLKHLGLIHIEVKPMGGDKVVLTFENIEERDSMLNGGNLSWLKGWFKEVHIWEENSSTSNSRLVWLNCYGVPLHLWNIDTFKRLGSIWGDVILISDDTAKCLSFSVGKVLISTEVMEVINQMVEVENKNNAYQVRIIEEQMVINTFLRADCTCPGCHIEESLVQSQCKDSGGEKVENPKLDLPHDVEENHGDNLEKALAVNVEELEKATDSLNKCDEMALQRAANLEVIEKVEDSEEREDRCDVLETKEREIHLVKMGETQLHHNNDMAAVIDSSSSLEIENSVVGNEVVLDSFGGSFMENQPLIYPSNCLADQEDGITRGMFIEDSSKKAEFADEDLGCSENVINEDELNLDHFDANNIPIQAAIKGIKGKSKRKSINEILGYSKVSKGNTKGRMSKNKCVVFRSAVASAALSASISSGGFNNRNRILLDEATAIWEVDKLFGLRYDGEEEEVISKIAEMEALNQDKAAACQL